METIKFLKKHKDVNKLTELYGIKIKEYEDRYVLNYCQIGSSKFKTHPIVRECRNLIISKNFEVLHRSFTRFFNLGENPADEVGFDILQAICYEKMDGSIIGIYFDGKKWNACTRGLAFAEGPTSVGVTFNYIIERALGGISVHDFATKNSFLQRCSYIFELVSPETRVVKPYDHTALYILAVRDKITGEYLDSEAKMVATIEQIRAPKVYTFGSIEEILESVKSMESDFDEGYVCEHNGVRLKVKAPAYLAVAHLRNNGVLSIPRVVKLVTDNETDEYLSVFPEDRHIFEPYIKANEFFLKDVVEVFNLYSDFNRKKFAMTVKDLPYSGVLFKMHDGKTLDEALEALSMDAKVRILESYIKKVK